MDNMPSTSTPAGTPPPPPSNFIVPKVMALHQKIVDALSQTITEAKARGLGDIGMESGIRTPEQQTLEYAKGRDSIGNVIDKTKIVTNAKPWSSWHNFGLAVDITPKNSKGQFYWWPDEDERWTKLGEVGKMFGLEWGGGWATFHGDLDHFQMRGKIPSVHEAKRILFESGLDKLWALI